MIVWLASYPRSGNSYLRVLLRALYGLESSSVYPEPASAPSPPPLPSPAVGAGDLSPHEFALAARAHSPDIHCVKTHDLPGTDDHRAIYLLRDGRDALVSYAWLILRQRESEHGLATGALDDRFQVVLRSLIVGEWAPFATWSRHVTAWAGRPRTVVVRFEQLVAAPEVEAARALAALGLQGLRRSGGRPPTFAELQREDPVHFRRGSVGAWRDEMPPEAQRLFASLHGPVMRTVGYDPRPDRSGSEALTFLDDLGLDEGRREAMAGRVAALESSLTGGRGEGGELESLLRQVDHDLADLQFAVVVASRPKWRRAGSALKRRFLERLGSPSVDQLRQHAPRDLAVPASYRLEAIPRRPPKISLVTPSLDSARFIACSIASVLEQDYPSLEYFVQDGGSRDGTADILLRCPPSVAWSSAPDGGPGAALNQAFARASGEILGWLNADDILLPGTLRYVARYLDARPDVDVVYGHRVVIDEDGREIGRWVLPPHDPDILRWADYVPQECLFWRRELWDRVGARVDDSLTFAFDWELLLRFRDAGARFVRLPRFLGAFRVHPGQKTSRVLASAGRQEMQRLRRRVHGRAISDLEVAEEARPYRQRARLYARLHRLGLGRLCP